MRYLLRRLARLGGPVSAKILKLGYFLIDGFYPRTEYCGICGFPISHDKNYSTPWADAEILYLVRKSYYVYPICKHCREHKPWSSIYEAYYKCWKNLYGTTDYLGFNWIDIRTALELDKKIHGVPGDVGMWKKILKDSYKEIPEGDFEFCGFKKGFEINELLEAVKQLNNKNIIIVKSDSRTSIRLKKDGKRKKEKERQQFIALPDKHSRS